VTARGFAFAGFRGEAAGALASVDLVAEARRLLDPAAATQTVHWGRNYLYRARVDSAEGALDVVVKQFREHGARARWARRRRGSRGLRCWRVARGLVAAGIATPEPLLYLESEGSEGSSLYVSRHLPDRIEARYLLRARHAGRERAEFPAVDFAAFLDAAAALARRLHEAGFWHRDFSIGNLLIAPGERPDEIAEIALLDLDRCRAGRRPSLGERMRDLARLPLDRPADRSRLLASYFSGQARSPRGARTLYELARISFHGRHRVKNRVRGAGAKLRSWLVPRGVHAHIPPPPGDASARDKIVWDHLSDQPHSHAGRLERTWVRIADAGDHARSLAALAGAWPRVRRCYRSLVAERNRSEFAWPGMGVALRPWPRDPAALLDAVEALGCRQALLRLHPWQAAHQDEEALARALSERGVELSFALPQSRELVRDPGRWQAAVEELAARFTPYGSRFQIGQAINRSKWGIWSYGEYLDLAAVAARILRRYPGVELLGPAVIDFEAHVTTAVVNRRHPTLRFDALASLLYVDRRGAPENRQLGYDSLEKATLLTAVAESSRLVGARRHWITEVNWPLAEGPHSPAGRKVAVDEERQADYLVRYALLTLGTGYVERVFWWQLVARGYGLIDAAPDGALRRRPAFEALATLQRELAGSTCLGPAPEPPPLRRYRFRRPDGGETWVVWSTAERATWKPPRTPESVSGRSGVVVARAPGAGIELGSAPTYLRFSAHEVESGTERA